MEGEDTSEEEVEVNNTLRGRVLISVSISQIASGQSGGHSTRSSMVNQDTTLRLHVFHGTGRDDAEQHWFTCEAICSMKRVMDEAYKIVKLETTLRDKSPAWYMKYKVLHQQDKLGPYQRLREIYLGSFKILSQNHNVSMRSKRSRSKLEKPYGTMTSGSKYCWTD
jgi:hypothetical protein